MIAPARPATSADEMKQLIDARDWASVDARISYHVHTLLALHTAYVECAKGAEALALRVFYDAVRKALPELDTSDWWHRAPDNLRSAAWEVHRHVANMAGVAHLLLVGCEEEFGDGDNLFSGLCISARCVAAIWADRNDDETKEDALPPQKPACSDGVFRVPYMDEDGNALAIAIRDGRRVGERRIGPTDDIDVVTVELWEALDHAETDAHDDDPRDHPCPNCGIGFIDPFAFPAGCGHCGVVVENGRMTHREVTA